MTVYVLTHQYNPGGYVNASRIAGVFSNLDTVSKYLESIGAIPDAVGDTVWKVEKENPEAFEMYFLDSIDLDDFDLVVSQDFTDEIDSVYQEVLLSKSID